MTQETVSVRLGCLELPAPALNIIRDGRVQPDAAGIMLAYAVFARRLLLVEPDPERAARRYRWTTVRLVRPAAGAGRTEVTCEACDAPVRIAVRSHQAAARRRLLALALLGMDLVLLWGLFTGRVGAVLAEAVPSPAVTTLLALAALLGLPWLLYGALGRRHHRKPFITGHPRFDAVRHRIA